MNKIKNYLLFILCSLLFVSAAHAVCPVCTIAVGGFLVFFEAIGVPDLVFPGIWAGGLTLSLVFWTAKYMNKKGVKSAWWYLLCWVGYYILLFCVYAFPSLIRYGYNTLWGIDQFLLGSVVGTIVLWLGENWHMKLKQQNGGKSYFPFQKVVFPIGSLLAITAIFAAIIYL